MLALDLAVITVVVGLLGLGASFVLAHRKKRKESDPREKGKRNAQKIDDLRCAICMKTINPDVDIYTQDSWWHKGCYRDVIE